MTAQKIPPTIKRSRPDEGPPKISSMAKRKMPSPFLIGFLLMILVAVLTYFLMRFEVIPPMAIFAPTQTKTSTATATLTATQLLKPSDTATVTPTIEPTATATATPTQTPTPTEKPMPFILMGTVQALPNTLLHPQYSCEAYLFIGGQVWDLQNSPVKNVTVRLTGEYGGEMVDEDVLTGSVTVYGESGYGFALPNKLVDGDLLYLQLLDPNGEPLSSPVELKITSSCQENLILVNFKQVR